MASYPRKPQQINQVFNFYYSAISEILKRAQSLGNHHFKYTNIIEKHFDQLVALIIDSKLDHTIVLDHLSPHPELDFKQIKSSFEGNEDELHPLLGCYYAIQLLHLNIEAIDSLHIKLDYHKSQYDAYKDFLISTGNKFRCLTAGYMKILLELFLPSNDYPEFVICGVGTRVDQDDIDLGIIDRGAKDRAILSTAFAKLNSTMLKYACTLHFHLSEHIGSGSYSASIQDYHDQLDNHIGDFVILSEMLNAVPILGSQSLFEEFKKEILYRYFYREGENNKYHEGLLRGILGEVRDLLYSHPPGEILNPKKDALRMIKALLFTFKTWKRIERNTSLEVLIYLLNSQSKNRDQFNQLYQALTFFETFRFLYQIFNVQEEEIIIDPASLDSQFHQIAVTMGFYGCEPIPPSQELIIQYHNHRQKAIDSVEILMNQVAKHLSKISSFKYANFPKSATSKSNLAVAFISQARFFEGVKYWDDVLTQLFNPNKLLIKRFFRDIESLSPYRQEIIIKTYLHWGFHTPNALMNLLVMLAKSNRHNLKHQVFQKFIAEFIKEFPSDWEKVERFYHITNFAPQTIIEFLNLLPYQELCAFEQLLLATNSLPGFKKEKTILRTFISTLQNSSFYFREIVYRTLQLQPQLLKHINEPKEFILTTHTLWYMLNTDLGLQEKINILDKYYLTLLSGLGLQLSFGADILEINREFTLGSDKFLSACFQIAAEELSQTYNSQINISQCLAVLVAGGHARSQAFHDDYDLLILTTPQHLPIAEKLLQKVNRLLTKSSIMPHYRFADLFGRYSITIADLEQFFKAGKNHDFIEKSLLLGSRPIIGNFNLVKVLRQTIIAPFIFRDKHKFCNDLADEINSRRQHHSSRNIFNLKESPGGLRDFENCIFCLNAHFEIYQCISEKLISHLATFIPDQKQTLYNLWNNYNFLKHVRDLYRLLVSQDDYYKPEFTNALLKPLNQAYNFNFQTPQELYDHLIELTKCNTTMINKILQTIGLKI